MRPSDHQGNTEQSNSGILPESSHGLPARGFRLRGNDSAFPQLKQHQGRLWHSAGRAGSPGATECSGPEGSHRPRTAPHRHSPDEKRGRAGSGLRWMKTRMHELPEGAWKSKPVVKACLQAGNHRITRATEEASRRARRNGRQNEKLLPHSVDPGRLASRFGKAVRPSVDPHGAAPWVYHPKLHQPQRGVANLTGRQLSE